MQCHNFILFDSSIHNLGFSFLVGNKSGSSEEIVTQPAQYKKCKYKIIHHDHDLAATWPGLKVRQPTEIEDVSWDLTLVVQAAMLCNLYNYH